MVIRTMASDNFLIYLAFQYRFDPLLQRTPLKKVIYSMSLIIIEEEISKVFLKQESNVIIS